MYIDRSVCFMGRNKWLWLASITFNEVRDARIYQSTFICDGCTQPLWPGAPIRYANIPAQFGTIRQPYSHPERNGLDSRWFTIKRPDPQLVLFANKMLSVKTFLRDDAAGKSETHSVKFISYDQNGLLWGIDQLAHLLQFNTDKADVYCLPKN